MGEGEGGGKHEEERERNRGKMKNEDFFCLEMQLQATTKEQNVQCLYPNLGSN